MSATQKHNRMGVSKILPMRGKRFPLLGTKSGEILFYQLWNKDEAYFYIIVNSKLTNLKIQGRQGPHFPYGRRPCMTAEKLMFW